MILHLQPALYSPTGSPSLVLATPARPSSSVMPPPSSSMMPVPPPLAAGTLLTMVLPGPPLLICKLPQISCLYQSFSNICLSDIDHVVPLSEAWKSGANEWTTAERRAFANDLTNPQLIAVTDSVNQSKSDKTPADWKPPLCMHPNHLPLHPFVSSSEN